MFSPKKLRYILVVQKFKSDILVHLNLNIIFSPTI